MSDDSVSMAKDEAERRIAVGVYPSELECDITSRGGECLHLRPIRPNDNDGLKLFHSRLSADSIYRRYFSMHPELTAIELAHLTQVDYVNRLALVIENGNQIVAVSRFERYPGTDEAEVAFIVADDYQHHGLGLLMLHHLADAAWARGITTFLAETLATNREMMSVFLASGFPVHTTFEDQEIMVRLSIEPTIAVQQHRDARRHVDGGTSC